MQVAGYSEGFRSEILVDGIKEYLKKVQSSVENNTTLYRSRSLIMTEKRRRKNWPTPVLKCPVTFVLFSLFLLMRDLCWLGKSKKLSVRIVTLENLG